jgi:dipeptidyl aminopeptidase/acylaminoacyl peptidase
VRQESARFHLDANRFVVMGHSAGGQLALCLAAHETSLRSVISLAGVVDLKKAYALHLSHDAVVEFLGGKPDAVPDHYREADPMELKITRARQWLLHGKEDDVVPPEFSFNAIAHCGHYELIDPSAAAFKEVVAAARAAVE